MKMMDKYFKWIEFYTEFADVLLQYKENKSTLMKKLFKAFTDQGLKMQKLWHDDNLPEYIDPFTIFGMFNKSIKDETRFKILGAIAKEFNVNAPVPTDFTGIPTINPLMANFYFFDCDMQDIDNLWETFAAAIALADNNTVDNREVFSKYYDMVQDQYGVKWNITMGFYWIRPYTYINLDTKNRAFLCDLKNMPADVVEEVQELGSYPPLAEQYLKLCEKCNIALKTGQYKYKNFPELSYYAWIDDNESQPEPVPDLGEKRYWVYQPGQKGVMWDEFYKKGIMAIGWPLLKNLSNYDNLEKMKQELLAVYPGLYKEGSNPKNDSRAVWEFSHIMKPGDIVFAKSGIKELLGWGIVESEYIYNAEEEEYCNVRKVSWKAYGKWPTSNKLPIKALTDTTGLKDQLLMCKNLFPEAFIESNQKSLDSSRFWWLNANPKIWSFSSLSVGDTESYTILNESGRPRRIPQNFVDVKPGDKLIGYESNPVKKIVAIGEFTYKDEKKVTFKKVETLANAIDYKTLKALDELQEMEFFKSPQGSLFKLTEAEYDCIIDLIREYNQPLPQGENKPYSKEEFLSEVFMTAEQYDEMAAVLADKKNIILQGAPGVGKTFAATRLAYAMMNEKNDSQIKAVQFHQNYSYEDFIMGYKPDGEGFTLTDGIFYKFCKEAENHQDSDSDKDKKYFFIIDEINRGNMSKIFGELLSRIENGYRGKKITLAYRDELFSIPRNLYIIGMMNTADRSLAMIDYALRRRFSFFEMKPGFETEGFKDYQKSLNNSFLDELINKIEQLNNEIENDKTLGNGFCIGHSYFCNLNKETCSLSKLRSIVKHDILPMLKEYWFDDQDKYEHWENQLQGLLND